MNHYCLLIELTPGQIVEPYLIFSMLNLENSIDRAINKNIEQRKIQWRKRIKNIFVFLWICDNDNYTFLIQVSNYRNLHGLPERD